MGRTIHYQVKTNSDLTDKQINKLINISDKYNSGKFKDVWTCENFYCNPMSYYPNWNKFSDRDNGWKIVNKRCDEIYSETHDWAKTFKQLNKEGYINFMDNNYKTDFQGFCKVQGNEFNSLLVYLALVEVSAALPKAEIEIHDEGEFLYCDVKLKNGRAWPLLSSLKESIRYYCEEIVLQSNHFVSQLDVKAKDKKMLQEFRVQPRKKSNSKMWLNYVDEKLRNAQEVWEKISKEMPFNIQLCIYNIENYEEGFDPLLVSRADQVDVQKFVEYKRSPLTLMDGFDGEGFGLSKESAAKKSVQSIFQMQKLLSPLLGPDAKLEILG